MRTLSIVVPTLNAAGSLAGCLQALASGRVVFPDMEILVVDGGSTDGTGEIGAAAGARVILALPGRGSQLAAGARLADGDWLLFLHADTVLAPDWPRVAADHMRSRVSDQGGAPDGRAGYFQFCLDDSTAAARRLERLVALRCRVLALPYGDQGLLISRSLYDRIGGYSALPLMEDVELIRRLGRRRLVALDSVAVTSAARYRRDGYWRRPMRNLACLSLYYLGVAPARIARLYG
ncbi:MAG: glycosyltransferase [Alphaproteobacteria bacterium]|nr:glycosyltransferase [Alphaproteobacteria bacterium]